MKVRDLMTQEIHVASPEDSIGEAARRMAALQADALPVGEGDRLVGMITDRDIAMKVAAENRDPGTTKIREVMRPELDYCFDDEESQEVALKMPSAALRGLPVLNRRKELVGVVSLSQYARRGGHVVAPTPLRGRVAIKVEGVLSLLLSGLVLDLALEPGTIADMERDLDRARRGDSRLAVLDERPRLDWPRDEGPS